MVVRIAFSKQVPEVALSTEHDAFREWMSTQPGFVRAHHCRNAKTGEGVSISYWSSLEDLLALKSKTPPGGPIGIKPDRVEIYAVEKEF